METDKTHRHIAPWENFNDTCGGYLYRQSASEPITEREAMRLHAAMGGRIEAIPAIEESEGGNEPPTSPTAQTTIAAPGAAPAARRGRSGKGTSAPAAKAPGRRTKK